MSERAMTQGFLEAQQCSSVFHWYFGDSSEEQSYGLSLLGHSRPPHLLHQGAVITPTMDHTMSMQPASMMGPITQQMNHLSLGTTGSVSTMHVINLVILRVLMAASCTVSSPVSFIIYFATNSIFTTRKYFKKPYFCKSAPDFCTVRLFGSDLTRIYIDVRSN